MSIIRTRIAPSPTGNLHIGTARTALFNYLFVKKHGGVFVLRIEDTDLERSDPVFEKDILSSLRWLGIEWDEGPDIGGKFGPYRQSERLPMYKKYLEKLLEEGSAFYCFHTEQELEIERENLLTGKQTPVHFCEYRDLSKEQSARFLKEKPEHIIRFKIPIEHGDDHMLTFEDIIRGQVQQFIKLLGDFSLAKNLETPLYNFAVVIDDYEMQITHVIRGEDHISNTPKQILIAKALGWTKKDAMGNTVTPWEYAHLPLILGPDRSKLSKRHGATSVDEYRKQGYLPETLFNFMALVGWNPGDEREKMSKQELINTFSLEHVQISDAIFDVIKLDWLNGEYIREKTPKELAGLCGPYLKSLAGKESAPDYIEKIVALEQPRLKKLSEIGEKADYFFKEPEYDKELLRWKNTIDQEILKALEFSEKVIKSKIHSTESGIRSRLEIERIFLEAIGEGDKGSILWPLRAALTGKKASPGPFDIIEILGAEETLKRLERAKKIL